MDFFGILIYSDNYLFWLFCVLICYYVYHYVHFMYCINIMCLTMSLHIIVFMACSH